MVKLCCYGSRFFSQYLGNFASGTVEKKDRMTIHISGQDSAPEGIMRDGQ